MPGLVVAPLLAGGRLLGLLSAGWRPGRVPADRAEASTRLLGVVEYAATALQNAGLLATVRHQSLHDSLTGLPNRVLFTQRPGAAVRQAGDEDSMAVLFCDLDRFKHVNDTFGHGAGDELLRQVAARLQSVLRDRRHRRPAERGRVRAAAPGGRRPRRRAPPLARRVLACFEDAVPPGRPRGARHRQRRGRACTPAPAGGRRPPPTRRRGDVRRQAARAQPDRVRHGGRRGAAAAAPTGRRSRRELRTAVETGSCGCSSSRCTTPGRATGRATSRGRRGGAGPLAAPPARPAQPGAFLPLAEETGLILDLDLWAVRTACAALAAQRAGCPAAPRRRQPGQQHPARPAAARRRPQRPGRVGPRRRRACTSRSSRAARWSTCPASSTG